MRKLNLGFVTRQYPNKQDQLDSEKFEFSIYIYDHYEV